MRFIILCADVRRFAAAENEGTALCIQRHKNAKNAARYKRTALHDTIICLLKLQTAVCKGGGSPDGMDRVCHIGGIAIIYTGFIVIGHRERLLSN